MSDIVESYKAYIEASNNEEDVTAFKANYDVFKGGLTKQEVSQYYNKWAENGQYDEHLCPKRYAGPVQAARAMAKHFHTQKSRENARVLDIAAGTGRLGAELYNLGFRNIDALDPSEGMLQTARERGIYSNFISGFIGGDRPVPVEDDAYDVVGCSGGFGEGHIPATALIEFIRIVRRGGVICIAMREEFFNLVSEYTDALSRMINNLETEGKWKIKAKDIVPDYAFEKSGIIFQFVVL